MRHRHAVGAFVLAAVVAFSGCAIPPVTTEQRPDGTAVTLEWAGYPGHAYLDAADILAMPGADEIEAHGREFIKTIRSEVAEEVGIRLTLSGYEGQWHPIDTNGYGRPSLLTSFSCCTLTAGVVPTEYADWLRIYDIVARVSAEFGAGPMITERDQDWVQDDPDQLAEFDKTWGAGVAGEYSLLAAWTTGAGQSVMLTIEDPARRVEATAAEKEVGPRISVDYSAVVIEQGKRAEFEKRLAPFTGFDKPDSTEWD